MLRIAKYVGTHRTTAIFNSEAVSAAWAFILPQLNVILTTPDYSMTEEKMATSFTSQDILPKISDDAFIYLSLSSSLRKDTYTRHPYGCSSKREGFLSSKPVKPELKKEKRHSVAAEIASAWESTQCKIHGCVLNGVVHLDSKGRHDSHYVRNCGLILYSLITVEEVRMTA